MTTNLPTNVHYLYRRHNRPHHATLLLEQRAAISRDLSAISRRFSHLIFFFYPAKRHRYSRSVIEVIFCRFSHPLTALSNMAATQTIRVSHLGGIEVGYAISGSTNTLDNSKPTCVLINALHTTVAFWRPQFEDEELTSTANLLAIEPLGHGATSCSTEYFTYWDTAIMALQVMDKLGVERAFATGTSQGGFIVARMALLAPERVSFHVSC